DSGLVLPPTGFNAEPFAPTLRTISGVPHSLWFHNGTDWEKISGLTLQSAMSRGNNTSRSLAITNNGGDYSGDGLFLGHFPSTSYSSIYSVIDGSSVGSIRIAKDYIGIASGVGTSTEVYVYPDSVRFGTPTHPVRVSGTAGIYPNDF